MRNLFHVLVEDKVHVGMMSLRPGLQNVGEIGGVAKLVIHKVLSKLSQIPREGMGLEQPVMVEIGDDDVFGISNKVNHLLSP